MDIAFQENIKSEEQIETQLSDNASVENVLTSIIGENETLEKKSSIYEQFFAKQKAYSDDFVTFHSIVMPQSFFSVEKDVKEFKVRDSDVWICTFPKCGTTWTQEICWLLLNKCDFDHAKRVNLDDRVPFLEVQGLMDRQTFGDDFVNGVDAIKILNEKPLDVPRIIKTHLPTEMLPDTLLSNDRVKLIFVFRNPRDVLCSFYNHIKVFMNYSGSFQLFTKFFIRDLGPYYTPFYGVIRSHLNFMKRMRQKSQDAGESGQKRGEKVFVTSYETMKRDLQTVVENLVEFFSQNEGGGGGLIDQQTKESLKGVGSSEVSGHCSSKERSGSELMKQLLKHVSFDHMKVNESVNKQDAAEMMKRLLSENLMENNDTVEDEGRTTNSVFMQSGRVGSWSDMFNNELDDEVRHDFEMWEVENNAVLQRDFNFEFEY